MINTIDDHIIFYVEVVQNQSPFNHHEVTGAFYIKMRAKSGKSLKKQKVLFAFFIIINIL
ncbi:hypothetical protein PLEI_0251 [Photobacterium leiognathi lrivu.4.1]|uniref:Uncharacterized protein n=1 Tax=Photobacterium leiognathi lrivu.4.1 TaxID=1248232 RepID=V5F1E0_PHOLE|nr:hypothetical protein PLEI_0251 [Photobacterium leiognathi lrivu.4.1]